MVTPVRTELEYSNIVNDDAESYVDEDDVRDLRLHYWLNETESLDVDNGVTRADSPLLGFDHLALMSARDSQLTDKPLPELPPSLSRLRSHSSGSSTVTHHPISRPAVIAARAVVPHRCCPSNSSSSSPSSRHPSLAHRPSLALLSVPLPPPVARESGRLHSIASSLSVGANRNAVYIDSAQVRSRFDEWLTSAEGPMQDSLPHHPHAPPPNTPMSPYSNPPASLSQIYVGKSPQGRRIDGVTTSLSPPGLASQPSLASLSHHVLSPQPSASSIGLAYQDSPPLRRYPSPPTASRWSLTSSVAENISQEKKKEKGGARKRLASIISRFTGHSPQKEAKQQPEPVPVPPVLDHLNVRGRSTSNASVPKIKSKSKPPSLKLDASIPVPHSPRSPIPSTPIPPSLPSKVTSPVLPSLTPISSPSPVKASFPSTRLSVSTSTTSTNTASPLMPTTPVFTDPLVSSPALKNAVSVPVLSHAYEGPGLIRRDGNFGEHVPLSRSKTYDDDDLEADAEYYTRHVTRPHVTRPTAEDQRKLRLDVITDMLDRDLNGASQPSLQVAPEPSRPQGLVNQPKDHGRIGVVDRACHFRASSTVSRSSSIQQRRSVSGPQASSGNVSTPPLPIKNGFRSLAARIGITSSPSAPQSLTGSDSKRESLARLMSNGKRKTSKRWLVISGVGLDC